VVVLAHGTLISIVLGSLLLVLLLVFGLYCHFSVRAASSSFPDLSAAVVAFNTFYWCIFFSGGQKTPSLPI
jgi:hypothetical protein